jgi:hypothetical protein
MNDDIEDPVFAELTHVHGWFNVTTVHGHRLEFVLRDAEDWDNGGQPQGFYVDSLVSMLGEEFRGDPERGIVEEQHFGHISLCLLAPNVEELMDGLGVCDTIIERWIERFGINDMKDRKL